MKTRIRQLSDGSWISEYRRWNFRWARISGLGYPQSSMRIWRDSWDNRDDAVSVANKFLANEGRPIEEAVK